MYGERDEYERSKALFLEILEAKKRIFGLNHPETADVLESLAALAERRGDARTAEPLISRASEIWYKEHGPEHPLVARSLHNIGLVLYEKGGPRSAEPYIRRALASREKVLGLDHPGARKSRELISECERSLPTPGGNPDETRT